MLNQVLVVIFLDKLVDTRKHRSINSIKNLFLSSVISCPHIIAALCLSVAAAAQASGANIDCPDGVYNGRVDLTFIRTDFGPVRNSIDDLFFFYGVEPKAHLQSNTEIQLKSLMICSDDGEEINTATRHIGRYTFLNKKCRITMNGRGSIKDAELVEQGDAELTCQEKSVYQGSYSIKAVNLLLTGDKPEDGAVRQETTETGENASSSTSSSGWSGLITEPEKGDEATEPELPDIPRVIPGL